MAFVPGGGMGDFPRGVWEEDDYLTQGFLDDRMRQATDPIRKQQNAALANLFRRRGLSGSGIEAGAMGNLAYDQEAGLASQALSAASLAEQSRQEMLNRLFQSGMAENQLSQQAQLMSYQPKESGLTGALGALGGLVSSAIPGVGQATSLMGLFKNNKNKTKAPVLGGVYSGFKNNALGGVGNSINRFNPYTRNSTYPGAGATTRQNYTMY